MPWRLHGLEEVFLRLRILEGVPASWFDGERSGPFVQSGLLREEDEAVAARFTEVAPRVLAALGSPIILDESAQRKIGRAHV